MLRCTSSSLVSVGLLSHPLLTFTDLYFAATQLVLVIFGVLQYKATTPSQHRSTRRPYFIFGLVLLALFSFSTITDSIYFAQLTIANASGDYGLILDRGAAPWYTTMGSVCNTIVILLGDAILVSVRMKTLPFL